jgi:hypothetical protein
MTRNQPRSAAVSTRVLNVLILVCASLIAVAYLIGILIRPADSSGAGVYTASDTGVTMSLCLTVLFGALDVLVLLRLGPAVTAVSKRAGGGFFLGSLGFVALGLSVIIFFGVTCYGMVGGR